jgi:hypothetical protein
VNGLSWVRLGYVRLAHAQLIIQNGVIIPPSHEFKQPSRWYYQVQDVKNSLFGVDSCGTNSILNLIFFRPAILQILNTFRPTCE